MHDAFFRACDVVTAIPDDGIILRSSRFKGVRYQNSSEIDTGTDQSAYTAWRPTRAKTDPPPSPSLTHLTCARCG